MGVQADIGTAVLFLSFTIILISIKLKVHLAISITLGAVLIYAAYGISVPLSVENAFISMGEPDSLRLIALVFLVIFMSRLMKVAGTLERISESLKRAFSDARVSYGAIPAIIGLLPMPAGALVSAQMVDRAADELGTSAEERTFTNYWFRHVWEFSWPFYQGVILTAVALRMSAQSIVSIMFPITLISIGVGYWYGIRPIKLREKGSKDPSGMIEFLTVLWPVWLVILISIGLDIDLVYGLVITDTAVIVWYGIKRKMDVKGFFTALGESLNANIFFIILSIMVFEGCLQFTGAVGALPAFMQEEGIWPVLAVIFLPMIVGMMSGLTVAFVGISFPILLPMLMPAGVVDPSMLALAYLSGFIGVLFSPMHLCLIFSADYFKADMGKVYRRLALPLTTLFILGAFYAWSLTVI